MLTLRPNTTNGYSQVLTDGVNLQILLIYTYFHLQERLSVCPMTSIVRLPGYVHTFTYKRRSILPDDVTRQPVMKRTYFNLLERLSFCI
jgi:hypothetical protein